MTPKPGQSPIDRFRRAYERDPRKVLVIAGLSVLMAGLWIRNVFTGPAPVSAAVKTGAAVVSPKISSAGANSPADVALLRWLDEPAPVVSRNLFAVNPELFPKGGGNSGRNDNSDQGAKSDHPGADDQKQQQAVDVLRTEASKYRLQSTLLGPHPMAVVNGQMVGVGDEIGPFKVERIRARDLTLAHDDVRIELNMD